MTIAMSTLTIQAGAETTTPKISSLKKCAALVVEVPQVDPMKAQMIALKAMKETTRVKETTKVKEMPAKKIMMAALETTRKTVLVMTP